MASAESSKPVPRIIENLSIQTVDELHDFWRTILPDFVKTVDPENSGYLQDLYSDQILTHTDYESLVSGKDYMPRAQKARKLWLVLSSYTLDLFRTKIAPRLLASFAVIIPDRFFASADQPVVIVRTERPCLRHDIQNRVRVETVADLLCHHGCMPHTDYGAIINDTSKTTRSKWNLIFDTFADQTSRKQTSLVPELQNLFTRYNVPFPDNVADVLSRGFLCTCCQPEPSPPDHVQSRDTKVKSWLERKQSTIYQPSPDSSLTRVEVSSHSSTLIPVSEHDTAYLTNDIIEDDNSWSPESAEYFINKSEDNKKTLLQTEGDLSPSAVRVQLPLSVTGQEIVPDPNVSVMSDSSTGDVVHDTLLATQQSRNPKFFETRKPDEPRKNSSKQENATVACMETVESNLADFPSDDGVCDQVRFLSQRVGEVIGRCRMAWLMCSLGPRKRRLLWLIVRIAVLFVVCSTPAVLRGRIVDKPLKALEIAVAAIVIPPLAFFMVCLIIYVVILFWGFVKQTVKLFYILLKEVITGDTTTEY